MVVSSRRYRIACTGFSSRLELIIGYPKQEEGSERERGEGRTWTRGWRTEEMQNSLFVSADEKVAWDVLPLSSP